MYFRFHPQLSPDPFSLALPSISCILLVMPAHVVPVCLPGFPFPELPCFILPLLRLFLFSGLEPLPSPVWLLNIQHSFLLQSPRSPQSHQCGKGGPAKHRVHLLLVPPELPAGLLRQWCPSSVLTQLLWPFCPALHYSHGLLQNLDYWEWKYSHLILPPQKDKPPIIHITKTWTNIERELLLIHYEWQRAFKDLSHLPATLGYLRLSASNQYHSQLWIHLQPLFITTSRSP